jgi:hypothetical protein
MSKPKIRITIFGTRNGKLRARVVTSVPYTDAEKSIAVLTAERPRPISTHYEVTIGGGKWNLPWFINEMGEELRREIVGRAKMYAARLVEEMERTSRALDRETEGEVA